MHSAVTVVRLQIAWLDRRQTGVPFQEVIIRDRITRRGELAAIHLFRHKAHILRLGLILEWRDRDVVDVALTICLRARRMRRTDIGGRARHG
jgi:hypothetical protein